MKKTKRPLFSLILIISVLSSACVAKYAKETKTAREDESAVFNSDFIKNKALPAVVVITNRVDGKKTIVGSAFAIARNGYIYRYATNAHVVLKEELEDGNIKIFSAELELALYDANGYSMGFYPAELIGASLIEGKEDFAIVEVKLELLDIPVLELSPNDPVFGHCAFTVGFPASTGNRVFAGFIYKLTDAGDKQVLIKVRETRDWQGISGSPVFDCRSKKVVAIDASGDDYYTNLLGAFPISAFRKFQKEAEVKYLKHLQSK